MAKLNLEMTELLDKLYNLRGDDNAILLAMDEEREAAEETKVRTQSRKGELEAEIEKLESLENSLASQGEKFKYLLAAFGEDDYTSVIERLGLEFNPEALITEVEERLPDAVNKLTSEKTEADTELSQVIEEMNDADTKLEELSIRKVEVSNNRERLNRFLDLALNSNINITRDEVTTLLEKFGFDEDEQREAAKLLMFPEDGLFEYEELRKENPDLKELASLKRRGKKTKDDEEENKELEEKEAVEKKTKKSAKKEEEKTETTDVALPEIEAPQEEIEPAGEIATVEADALVVDEPKVDDAIVDIATPVEDVKVDEMISDEAEAAEAPKVDDTIVEETPAAVEPTVDNNLESDFETLEIKEEKVEEKPLPPIPDGLETPKDEVKEETSSAPKTKEDLINLLSTLGLDYLDFKEAGFNKLLENYNEELIKDNIALMDALNLKHDMLSENAELLYDKDLKTKITKLTSVGKLPEDIYLNPKVLVKYTYSELEDAIKALEESGLEPRKVPLIAY